MTDFFHGSEGEAAGVRWSLSSWSVVVVVVLVSLGGFGVAGGVRQAWADGRDPVAGEALFREGRRLLKAGDLEGACTKLEESQRLDPAPGTLANLADCQEKLGRSASAWEHWRRVAEQLPPADPRRATAVARSAELEKKLSRLVIERAPDAPVDLKVKRDDVELGAPSLGLALPLDPGPHVVTVSAPNRLERRFEVLIAPGEQSRLVVGPGAPPPPPPAMPAALSPEALELQARASQTATHSRVGGYALLGAGAVALGAGAYFGSRALQARADAKAACSMMGQPPLCWSRAKAPLDRDVTYARLADVSFAAGAIAAVVGSYFLLGARGHEPRPGSVALAAAPLPAGAEVQLAGRF